MADKHDDKRARKTPARFWLRVGWRTATVIARIILFWLDLNN